MIDLHMHSTDSDGKRTKRELIDWAIEKNMSAIAITDHDTVNGVVDAMSYAKNLEIEVIPGIEFSSKEDVFFHILGLFINPLNSDIIELTNINLKRREVSKKNIIEKLNKFGYKITFEELKKESGNKIYGRPHIARILMRKYPDKFHDIHQVFNDAIGSDGFAFDSQDKFDMKTIIDMIHKAHGIAILAHPGLITKNEDKLVKQFVKFGGDGIEVNYYYERIMSKGNSVNTRDKYAKFAEENNLIVSGGSDHHESQSYVDIGTCGISLDEFQKMKNYHKSKF